MILNERNKCCLWPSQELFEIKKKKNVRESLELGFIFKLMDSASVVYLGGVV